MLEGKIIKQVSNFYTVYRDGLTYICKPRGKFHQLGISPFVGDHVLFDKDKLIIEQILDRKSYLLRPRVSNIDLVLIVSSLKEPLLSLNLLDKQISNIYLYNLKPLICFTKLDLANQEELDNLEEIRKYYESIGIKTFTNLELDELISYLKEKVVVLTGQSGAGKSSLLNKIDSSFNLQTREISKALNRGKHTTRHTEIYLTHDIWFCDTPGFSSLELTKFTKEQIRDSFLEFDNYNCKFRDCFHIKEIGCEVKQAVLERKIMKSRYEDYKCFIKEGK